MAALRAEGAEQLLAAANQTAAAQEQRVEAAEHAARVLTLQEKQQSAT